MRYLLGVSIVLLSPMWAQACAVCSDGEKQNAMAFFWTTLLLTLLPLGLLAGLVRWVQKRSRQVREMDTRDLGRS